MRNEGPRNKDLLITPILLLIPIIATCVFIASHPTIIMYDTTNNPTAFSFFLIGSYFLIFVSSALLLTLYFSISKNVRKSRLFPSILMALAFSVVASGLTDLGGYLGFPYDWTRAVYSSHCGYGLNNTSPSSYQCFTRQSGITINPSGVGLDIAIWLSIVELILWGSLFFTSHIASKNCMWILVASGYSGSILVSLFSIFLNPPTGYPISPWRNLMLSICTQYTGSWCYGLQSNVLLIDFVFWVALSFLSIILVGSVFNKKYLTVKTM